MVLPTVSEPEPTDRSLPTALSARGRRGDWVLSVSVSSDAMALPAPFQQICGSRQGGPPRWGWRGGNPAKRSAPGSGIIQLLMGPSPDVKWLVDRIFVGSRKVATWGCRDARVLR